MYKITTLAEGELAQAQRHHGDGGPDRITIELVENDEKPLVAPVVRIELPTWSDVNAPHLPEFAHSVGTLLVAAVDALAALGFSMAAKPAPEEPPWHGPSTHTMYLRNDLPK